MREIAARAGMTAGNVYYYYRSKGDLIADCQELTLQALETRLAAIERSDLSPGEAVESWIRAHVHVLLEESPGGLAHVEVAQLPAERRRRILERRRNYQKRVERLLARGVELGELRPIDPALTSRILLGALNWIPSWFDRGGSMDSATLARELVQLFFSGLARAETGT